VAGPGHPDGLTPRVSRSSSAARPPAAIFVFTVPATDCPRPTTPHSTRRLPRAARGTLRLPVLYALPWLMLDRLPLSFLAASSRRHQPRSTEALGDDPQLLLFGPSACGPYRPPQAVRLAHCAYDWPYALSSTLNSGGARRSPPKADLQPVSRVAGPSLPWARVWGARPRHRLAACKARQTSSLSSMVGCDGASRAVVALGFGPCRCE
jgi:hypothetical protein